MKRHEADLVELQRRAALGTLCAAVAHEVHGPLDCASVALRHALDRLRRAPAHASDPGLERELSLAAESVALAHGVLHDSMRLATPDDGVGTADLSTDVDSVLSLASVVKPLNVVVAPRLDPGLRVVGTTIHVQQIALNLLLNAFRALEDKPRLEEGLVTVATSPGSAGFARLVVSDNGPGIPARLRARIFEPFAAARLVGQGPGLGLHVVKRITDLLGGSVEVDSVEGRGTSVTVDFAVA